MKRLLFAICCFFLSPSLALGAPSIGPASSSFNGTMNPGQTITVTGSGFGVKNPAAPIMYADFASSLSAPSPLSRITSWNDNRCFVWGAGYGIGGGGGIRTDQSCGGTDTATLAVDTSSIFNFNELSQKFYIFRQHYKAYTDDVNLKSLEIISQSPFYSRYLIWNTSVTYWGSVATGCWCSPPPDNQWVSEELTAQTGASQGVKPIKLDWYYNNVLLEDVSNCPSDFTLRDNSTNLDMAQIVYHGDYNCGGNCPNMELEYFDNPYVDNTWQHIIIGNASTLAASSHREIQIPTGTWVDGSLQFVVNRGSFGASSTAYLYVIDANNAVNAGVQFTFGQTYGGGDTTPPTVMILTTDPSIIAIISLAITGSASDDVGVTSCKYRIGAAPTASLGTALTGTTSWSGTAIGFSLGTNTLYVGCTDAAGNWGTEAPYIDSMTVTRVPRSPTNLTVTQF